LAGITARKAPARATRYNHRLSNKRRLAVAIWQEGSVFYAIVRSRPEVFEGSTHEEAFRRLVGYHEKADLDEVAAA
jgi:hypothetical protein